jgi:hypothetical protein
MLNDPRANDMRRPLLFTQDHLPLWLGDIYRERSAFLIGGGPSFASLDHVTLRQPGILTMAMNNAVKTFRPHFWVSVDAPDHFLRSIWLDPTIMKFVPFFHSGKYIFNSDEWKFTGVRVGDCPNVIYFKQNDHFESRQFLTEYSLNWGNSKEHGGGLSVMLPAIRLLFILGIRRVYLLGVDFKMDEKVKYHFEQERSGDSISRNNETFAKLAGWFDELRPIFEAQDFFIYNCNPESNLKAFNFVSFDKAVADVLAEFGRIDITRERTKGMYDTKFKDKQMGVGRGCC